LDGKSSSFLVGSDANEEVLLGIELSRVGESSVTDLVEGIGRVGDELSKEDFLNVRSKRG
jgi:allophanate hydrolase subunit 2